MSARTRRRVSEVLTGAASLTFPRARHADARAVRDCAREAVDDAGLRALPRECLSLAMAGLRTRPGEAALDFRRAPWRAALSVLTLPLASTILLVWIFGFIPRYDHWPLGEGWAMLLGGSLLALIGAALRYRWLTAVGATATLVAAAAPYVGYGTDVAIADTPSFFRGWSLDIGAASLLPTLLLVAGGLSLPRRSERSARVVLARVSAGLVPAVIAVAHLWPGPSREPTRIWVYGAPAGSPPKLVVGAPYEYPWIPASRPLITALGIALAVAVVFTWRRASAHPQRALASGLVLASVAYPLAWIGFPSMSVPYWAYEAPYFWAAAALPLMLALTLVRRAGRACAAPG